MPIDRAILFASGSVRNAVYAAPVAGQGTAMVNDYLLQLLAAGLEPHDVLAISTSAAEIYDMNRKAPGAISGPLGLTGTAMYRHLTGRDDDKPNLAAFQAHHPFTIKSCADRTGLSRESVGAALKRLIDHGFLHKRRDGRASSVQLFIPGVALCELGSYWSAQSASPGTLFHDYYRPLGEKVLELFPANEDA